MCKQSRTFRGFCDGGKRVCAASSTFASKRSSRPKKVRKRVWQPERCCGERFSICLGRSHREAWEIPWRVLQKSFVFKDKQQIVSSAKLTVILPRRRIKTQEFMRLLWRQLFNATKWWSDGILYPKGQLHLRRDHAMKARRPSALWKTVVCKWKQRLCSLITFHLNCKFLPAAHFKMKNS